MCNTSSVKEKKKKRKRETEKRERSGAYLRAMTIRLAMEIRSEFRRLADLRIA